jgi:hypothetical protein
MGIEVSPADALALFADGLALVFHEARHVRHLIKAGFVPAISWSALTMLAANRVVAWRQIQPQRMSASKEAEAAQAAAVFEARFNKGLTELSDLYRNPHWRHAAHVGGHAWLAVAAAVSALGSAIDSAGSNEISLRSEELLMAKHNNGSIAAKIVDLDQQIGSTPRSLWMEYHAGA